VRDLNDFYFFHAVVTHRGFSAAERATGVPKGTLSKAVARLEDRLKVRLIERTTRKLRTTEVGRAFYEQCEGMLGNVEAAEAAAAQAQAEPYGLLRVSCPQALLHNLIEGLLLQFMAEYPKVRVQVKVPNRPAHFVDDGVDVALRVRSTPARDSSMVIRTLGTSRLVLAMSPKLQRSLGKLEAIEQLGDAPTLSMSDDVEDGRRQWQLVGPGHEMRLVAHRPRLLCSNTDMLNAAAVAGVGVALLPDHVTRPSFASGALVPVLPDWCSTVGTVQAAYPSKKSLFPATRALLAYLAREIPQRTPSTARP